MTTATGAANRVKVWTFTVDTAAPTVAQAASLALVVLSKTKAATWDELEQRLTSGDENTLQAVAGVHLDEGQHHLLSAHPLAVRLVGPGPPLRSIAVCGECGEFFALVGSAPSRCPMGVECEGRPAKAPVAKGHKTPVGELPAPELGDDAGSKDEDHDAEQEPGGAEAGSEEAAHHHTEWLQVRAEDLEEFDFA